MFLCNVYSCMRQFAQIQVDQVADVHVPVVRWISSLQTKWIVLVLLLRAHCPCLPIRLLILDKVIHVHVTIRRANAATCTRWTIGKAEALRHMLHGRFVMQGIISQPPHRGVLDDYPNANEFKELHFSLHEFGHAK